MAKTRKPLKIEEQPSEIIRLVNNQEELNKALLKGYQNIAMRIEDNEKLRRGLGAQTRNQDIVCEISNGYGTKYRTWLEKTSGDNPYIRLSKVA